MRTFCHVILCFCVGLLFSTPVLASEVRILYPEDGETIYSSPTIVQVYFYANFGFKGDHIHLSVDGKDKETLTNLQVRHTTEIFKKGRWDFLMIAINGRTDIDPLSPGQHEICAKVVDKAHMPIGEETCIHVVSK